MVGRRNWSALKKENNNMTKVAVTIFDDIFEANGYTMRVRRMVPLLNRMCTVTVIAASNESQNKLAGMDNVHIICLGKWLNRYRLLPLPVKPIPILIWNLKLALVLLRNRFDVVWCSGDFLGFLGVYLTSKVRKYRVIFEAYDIVSKWLEKQHSDMLLKLDRSLEKFVVKHADFVLAISKNPHDYYQVYNAKIDLAPYCLDTTLFKPAARTKTPDSRLIGLIGPFAPDYIRTEYCLRFLRSRINDFDNKLRFVAIGRCDRAIKHDRIRYTGYLASEKDYAEQLSHLDAVLVVENISTWGPLTKVLESMSCSVPVFATPKAVTGLSRFNPGRDIFVFEENEMVNKINELIFNDELMAEIGNNARKVIKRYYSKKANEERVLRILQLVMGG